MGQEGLGTCVQQDQVTSCGASQCPTSFQNIIGTFCVRTGAYFFGDHNGGGNFFVVCNTRSNCVTHNMKDKNQLYANLVLKMMSKALK